MTFQLPPLPYPKSALEPHLSARTLEFHHDHHHRTYVEKLNKLIEGTPFASKSLEEIILATTKSQDKTKTEIFNNAAQNWNHSFLWNCMTPDGGHKPSGGLAERIDRSFGDLGKFHEEFKKAATGQFGSGYAWLVADGSALKVIKTANAENPLVDGATPLLACDVWEHAYYLDYQDKRADFVDIFLDRLVNWKFVSEVLGRAGKEGPAPAMKAQGGRR
jgi:Fe-Mn family superoxide dismutase